MSIHATIYCTVKHNLHSTISVAWRQVEMVYMDFQTDMQDVLHRNGAYIQERRLQKFDLDLSGLAILVLYQQIFMN